MPSNSSELTLVYDNAYKLNYLLDNNQIDCMNLLLSMSTTKCLASHILRSKGFTEEMAQSFIAKESHYINKRTISTSAEKAINQAKIIATSHNYDTVYSPHLLLAIVESGEREVAQILKDYQLNTYDIEQIVKAIEHNKIGKDINTDIEHKQIKLNKQLKNKQLEKHILSILKNNK